MNVIRKIFYWIFKAELHKLESKITETNEMLAMLSARKRAFDEVLSNIDVSVDVHEYHHDYSPSWAVISLQGKKSDYIKFIDLGPSDIREIGAFLRQFERRNISTKVDATPIASSFLKVAKF